MKMLIVCACIIAFVAAQDPAPGWLAYATAKCPPGTKITHMQAQWPVLSNPAPSQAFYSPWFGIDASDNLNLLQPVNPWYGSDWLIYTEYYQWVPSYNQNSAMHQVNAGDRLLGQITYNGDTAHSYYLRQTDTTASKDSSQTIAVQKDNNGNYKNFTIAYIVFEKVANCGDYPPDNKIVFSNIELYCSGQKVTPQWTTGVVDEVCNFQAKVIDPATVEITWDSSMAGPSKEQFARNDKGRQTLKRPAKLI